MQKKMLLTIMVAIMVSVLAACGSDEDAKENTDQDNDASETKEISIGLDPYDYSTVPAYLTQVIMEQEGYEVDIEEADVGVLYEALSSEEIDAFIDVWSPNLHEDYLEKYGDSFVIAGTLFNDMPFGMGVPSYMDDINTIEDVADNPELFDNEVYAIDPGSGMAYTTDKMVETYEMDDFKVQNSTIAAMLQQVETKMDKEEGIVFNAWRPHPMFVRYDIKFLEDPRGSWKQDNVEIGVTPSFEEDYPEAFTLFSNMELDLDMVEEWILELDKDVPARELAETWVEENEDIVNEWLEK